MTNDHMTYFRYGRGSVHNCSCYDNFAPHTFDIVIDLTSQKPLSNVIRLHDHVHKRCWEEADSVCDMAELGQYLAIEVDGVDIHLIAHAQEVPVDLVALAHAEARQVAEHVAINC